MSCQFIHLESYARVGARCKAGGRRHSIANIVAELMREPHACPHVEDPKPPNILFGIYPTEAAAIASGRASEAVDAIGRKLRRDTPTLLAGVVSWPVPESRITNDAIELKMYEDFRRDVIEWLCDLFGPSLLTCAEHRDEAFPHVHFLVVPTLRVDGRMSISDVHPGLRARKQAQEDGGNRKECDRAYCVAMSEFQDRFSQDVAMKHGLLRMGPKRQRLSRSEWVAQKKQALDFAAKQAERERKAEERERQLRSEMADRERDIDAKAAAAVEAMKQSMATKATTKAREYFTELVARQQELVRQIAENESLLADKNERLAELHEMLQERGISISPAKKR